MSFETGMFPACGSNKAPERAGFLLSHKMGCFTKALTPFSIFCLLNPYQSSVNRIPASLSRCDQTPDYFVLSVMAGVT